MSVEPLLAVRAWSATPSARWVMAALQLALMSSVATTAFGGVLLALALVLASLHPRLTVMLAFTSGFLPFVGGLPVSGVYVVALWFLLILALDNRGWITRVPAVLVGLGLSALALCAATYPIHRSADVPLLAASVVVALACANAIRKEPASMTAVRSDILLAVSATLLVPLLCNGLLVVYSPFWFDRHIGLFTIGRFTVGAAEANVLSAYMAAAFTVVVFSVRYSRNVGWRLAGTASLASALAIGASLGGSRTAIGWCVAATAAAIVLSLANRRASTAICWPSVRALCLSLVAALSLGIGCYTLSTGRLPAGLERLASTSDLEETGRPKSIREASSRLDSVPLVGIDYKRYVLYEAPHTPHASPAASLLFLGLPLACLAFAMMGLPAVDFLSGGKVGGGVWIGLLAFSLLAILLTLPMTSDRGLLALAGTWFGLSRLPSLAARDGASAAGRTSVSA